MVLRRLGVRCFLSTKGKIDLSDRIPVNCGCKTCRLVSSLVVSWVPCRLPTSSVAPEKLRTSSGRFFNSASHFGWTTTTSDSSTGKTIVSEFQSELASSLDSVLPFVPREVVIRKKPIAFLTLLYPALYNALEFCEKAAILFCSLPNSSATTGILDRGFDLNSACRNQAPATARSDVRTNGHCVDSRCPAAVTRCAIAMATEYNSGLRLFLGN